jgi:catechol 2,3-dioxygenase-like lactoylglutathione lyase family enzyme
MLNTCDLIAFVPAVDMEAAREFYGRTLGLDLVEENPAACVFDAHGTMLRVTAVPEAAAAPYTVLGWAVADIAATVDGLRQGGVAFRRFDGLDQDDLGVWRSPGGDLVAWFADPAGNTLSVTQFAARPQR